MCLFCCVSFFALAVVFFNQPKAQKYGKAYILPNDLVNGLTSFLCQSVRPSVCHFVSLYLFFLFFVVSARPQQLLHRFCSDFTDKPNISKDVHIICWSWFIEFFTELLPFDEICTGHSRSRLCNTEQFSWHGALLEEYSSPFVLVLPT